MHPGIVSRGRGRICEECAMKESGASLEGLPELQAQLEKAEAALRRCNAKIRAILESFTDKFFVLDNQWRIIRISPPVQEYLTKPLDKYIGKVIWDEFPEAVNSEFSNLYRKAMLERVPAYLESVSIIVPGHWFQVFASPCDEGIEVYFRDITESKLAQAALLESEDRYRDLIENSHDLICTHDLEGNLLSVNRTAANVLGLSVENLIGRNIRDGLLPEYRDQFDDYLETIKREGFATGVMTVRTSTGEKRTWEYKNTLRTKGVAAPIVRGMAHDITDRIRAEAALRKSEKRFRALIEHSSDGIMMISEKGEILYISPSTYRIMAYLEDELKGKNAFSFVHPDDLEYVKGVLKELQPGESVTVRFRIRHKDGLWRLLESTCNNLLAEPSIQAIVINYRDITERKNLEEQLLQAQKMEATGRLAGGIAHDFNNLLTAIVGYSQLALSSLNEGDPLYERIREIKKAGQRATLLTNQLLAFSRKQSLQPVVIELNALIEDIKKMLQRIIGEDTELVTILEPDLGRIKADPGQIHQVIVNLAVNARDAMPRGGLLTIETANMEVDEYFARHHIGIKPGPYVLLTVSDTGCGMDKETLSQIFEPFFTTKESGKGTGLGLATVYGITKQSGGGIWVYSEIGKGTTFKIYLPRVSDPVEARPDEVPRSEAPGGSETILLVEDEEIVRKLAHGVLTSKGYIVLDAANAGEALLYCERYNGTIDLMLTDVVMPQMSGPELAQRAIPLRPQMKLIYMSGYGDAVLRYGIMKEDTVYLQKPFTPDELARKVRNTLDLTNSGH